MSEPRKRLRNLCVCAITAMLLVPRATVADKPATRMTDVGKMATNIVVGKVTAIYKHERESGDQAKTHFVAEVKIEKIEKGEGLQAGGLAYVRYWESKWVGEGFPPPDSEQSFRNAPRPKQRLRIYLAKNAYDGAGKNDDTGLNVIFSNGFEPLP